MTSDDRSPVVRLESRGARRGPASMADAVRLGLVRRRRRRVVVGLSVVIAVVVGIGVLLTDSPQPDTIIVPAISTPSSTPPSVVDLVEVPDVVGLAVDDADTTLQAAGLVPVRVPQETIGVPINEVFEQNPGPGRQLRPGDEVEILVSVGDAPTVPAVLALPQDDAIAALAEAGYEWVIEFQADIAETGLVIAMDPAPGTVLSPGEAVTLAVSAGPEQVVVPDLEGLTPDEAIDFLASAGFRLESLVIEDPVAPVAEAALVARTEPPAGSLVAPGAAIQIVISGAFTSVAVPAVVGLFFDTAMQTLRTAGLEPVVEFRTVPFGDPQVGLVVDQTPANFVLIPIGSEVVITVGEAGPEPPP